MTLLYTKKRLTDKQLHELSINRGKVILLNAIIHDLELTRKQLHKRIKDLEFDEVKPSPSAGKE
jgi:hypothetical protein